MKATIQRIFHFGQWSVFAKIMFSSLAIIFLIILSFAIYFLPKIKDNIIENKQRGLRNALECVVTQIEHLDIQVNQGLLTLEEAQEKAVEIVSVTRFNEKRDYMYANDLAGYCRASSVQENIGTFVANSTDYFGQDTHQTYVNLAHSPEQGGYTFFSWKIKDPNFRDSILVTRMYCMEFFEPWGWYFVNGMSMVDPRIDDDIQSEVIALRNTFYGVLLIIAIIALGISYWSAGYIRKRILQLTSITREVSRGNLDTSFGFMEQQCTLTNTGDPSQHANTSPQHTDEVGQMAIAMKDMLWGLKEKARFAQRIGENDLEANFKTQSENDVLGKALIDMRDNLKKARQEEQQRKKEDEKRNWDTQGQALFADIIRQNSSNMEELCYAVLKKLIQYVDANQGGVFIYNQEDHSHSQGILELTACYAFDRKKFVSKQIHPGEGLVGAVFLEKKTSYISNIPQDYINITSGLGGANPGYLLLVPLIYNEQVFGVIELASFKPLEEYQIRFTEKLAENVASSISTVKISTRTAYLLEQSQQQAEEMRAQEEEMRQNMEEMQATQEEMARKEQTFKDTQQALDKMCSILEINPQGNITHANDNFCKATGYSLNEIKGKPHRILLPEDSLEVMQAYSQYWDNLQNGQTQSAVFKRKDKSGSSFTVKGLSNPVMDHNGNMEKVIEITIELDQTTEE